MTDKQTVKFGDICKEVKLTTKDPIGDGYERYIGLEHLDSGSLKIKRWGIIAEDNPSFTRVFKKGHILFGKRRPYLKKAAVAEFDGICSGDIIVMEPKDALEVPALLPFIVQSEKFWDWAIKTSSGSLSPRTKFSVLSTLSLDIPVVDKQQTLLNVLTTSQQAINCASDMLVSTERLFHSVLTDIFKKGLKDPSWSSCVLDDCAEIQTGLALSSSREFTEDTFDVPYLRVANVYDGRFELDEIKYVKATRAMIERFRVRHGDILVAEGGDFDKVGRGHIWTDEVQDLIHQNHLFAIRTDQNVLLPEFFNYLKSSFIGIKFFLGIAQQTTNLATINATQVRKFPCIFPTLEKQQLLIQQLDDLKTSLKVRESHVEELKTLNRHLLG
ncbi:restriction endonuclease subunit S [Vibrio vulnificus]|uniref:restriction endonuclease subunit S n=1 Tax=Vibrio vulnificus TaxID=672 RepID=UPI0009C0CEC5|nr:restriction endonuclease subunit S [Vibrio vulnificus]EGQ7854661.1 restriction endonuclease subunit S [Vibrio vulnificus]EGQ9330026.1 restriction endonuclease subunit S [Vibrio vulnificus]ELK2276721.1 restriction endonuclease subunit S [Vibrio vulnificus]MCU8140060.1 restriction endonuclease subunit S [Vibrio vulnificus]MCU8386514.1 restriction endonuclease subunit S [Vibrio vulnificus]